jgi:flagellar assembly factor FliW
MSETSIRLEHPLARGTVVAVSEAWTFPEGLIGLPRLTRFALVPIPGAGAFHLLCSLEDAAFGVVVVDPCSLVPDYVLTLTPEDLAPLGTTDPDEVAVWAPVVLPVEGQPLTLNLRGPILLAANGRRGVQRISPDESHAVRHEVGCLPSSTEPCSS